MTEAAIGQEQSEPRRRPSSQVHLYTELAREIRASGLMARRYGWYWSMIVATTAAFVLLWVGVVRVGDSWVQLVLAALLGVLMTQFGFLGHDAAHRQVFVSGRWNDAMSRVCGGLFAGLGFSWWKDKHNRHHVAPNQEGRDPDIAPGAIAFTADLANARSTGFGGWFQDRQGWLFFPLLTLEGLNLQASTVRTLWEADASASRRLEALTVAVRLAAYVVVLLLVMSPGKAAAFVGVQSAVFGLCLGASFAPAHKGMPIIPPGARIDFLRRQVLVSRNIRGGMFVDLAMGGLNYQIEHHLFPSMARPNLRRARPLVRDYCKKHGVSYAETGLLESYGIVIDYLNHVGLKARGPFDCPLAAQLGR